MKIGKHGSFRKRKIKLEKDSIEKETIDQYTYENWYKNSHKILANQIQKHIKFYIPGPSSIYSWNSRMVQHTQINQNNIPYQQNMGGGKPHALPILYTKKVFDRVQHHFIIKNTQQTRNRRKLPQYNIQKTHSIPYSIIKV